MNPTLLNAIIGTACTLGGVLLTLYVRDKAREAVKEEMSTHIGGLFAEFKIDLLAVLDNTYRRSGECNLIMSAIQDRIDINEKRLDSIDESVRDMNNRIRNVSHSTINIKRED
jgi:hypothetical protein